MDCLVGRKEETWGGIEGEEGSDGGEGIEEEGDEGGGIKEDTESGIVDYGVKVKKSSYQCDPCVEEGKGCISGSIEDELKGKICSKNCISRNKHRMSIKVIKFITVLK